MGDDTLTIEDAVKMQWRAFAEGALWGHTRDNLPAGAATIEARRRFPYPATRTPRVVAGPLAFGIPVDYRLMDGALEARPSGYASAQWEAVTSPRLTPELIALLADLHARPFVDDDGEPTSGAD